MSQSLADQISFDPLSWIHTAWLPEGFSRMNNRVCRGIVNSAVNRRYCLAPLDVSSFHYSLSHNVMTNWYTLKSAAFYMACQRHRGAIIQSGIVSSLPEEAMPFLRMNIVPALSIFDKSQLVPDIDNYVYTELEAISMYIDKPLSDRLLKLIPETKAREEKYNLIFNDFLYKIATRHARNYTITF